MSSNATPRREFLGQVAASAIVLAGAGCTTPAAAGGGGQSTMPTPAPTPAPSPAQPPARTQTPFPARTSWDDSWFARLTAKHKAVFDSPEIDDGLGVSHAIFFIRGMHDAIGAGDADVQAVLVIRHTAIPMAFNDAMWEKYELGKARKIKTPRSDQWATRNPYLGGSSTSGGGRSGGAPAADRPQATLTWLAAHGHILLGCDQATRNLAGTIARQSNADQRVVYEDLCANVVPSLILQPTGVYAVHRAQEAGCTYIRST
jgi:hypothetical protein